MWRHAGKLRVEQAQREIQMRQIQIRINHIRGQHIHIIVMVQDVDGQITSILEKLVMVYLRLLSMEIIY